MSQNINSLVKLVKSDVSCLLSYTKKKKKTGSGLGHETHHNLMVSFVCVFIHITYT